jgi:predicted permease
LLAVGGTMLGLLLAWWIVDVIIASVPADLPGLRETTPDSNVLVFAIGLCGLTAILFGLLPAWRISRMAPLAGLQAGSRGNSDGPQGSRLRTALVSAQVALGTLLLIGAGLLLASFSHVLSVPRGFEVNGVIGVDLSIPETKYRTFEQKLTFFRRVQEEMAALPGVRQLAYSTFLPLIGPGEGGPAIPEGAEKLPVGERPFFAWHRVGSEYFAAIGTPMLAGKAFEEGESDLAAVVSQTAAQRLWPRENPIGKKFRLGGDPTKSHWFRVAGVLADGRFGGLDQEPLQSIYLPYWQVNWRPISELKLVVRTSMEPKAIAAAVREKVRNVDRDVAVGEVRQMTRALSDSVARRRFQAMMLAAFALIALMLAATGIYGVVAYNVAQRRAEMGMRMALGARPRDVTLLMIRQGMKPVSIGLAAGLACAAVLTRFIASLLFEVRPLDSLTFATVPALLSIIGVLACYLPARQAGEIDPMVMLRLE